MKLYELKANHSCKKQRSFAYKPTAQVEDHVRKAHITIKACKDLLFGKAEEDVKEEFHDEFEQLYYPTQITRDAEEDLAWKEITRYVQGEMTLVDAQGKPYRLSNRIGMSIDIGVGEDVYVEPDFVRLGGPFEDNINHVNYDATITVVKLHAGKPRGAREVKKDLAKYAMMKYARQLVSPGKTVLITVSDIYLKRADDAGENAAAPKFALNFWDAGGNNVISLFETYVGGTTKTSLDVEFEPAVKAFTEGHEAEECSESDCEQCHLYDLCHYAEPPIRINKTHVQKTIRDLMLTAAQDDAIEYENGVVRINAGAGVGKTVVVALRTVTLLNKGIRPEEIVLMTFTNSGAEEMRSRIQLYNDDVGTGEDISEMKICTFNSFGDDILKIEYAQFGFSEPPKVIDEVERAGIISNLLKTRIIKGLNYKRFYDNTQYVKGAVWIAARVFEIVKKGPYTILDIDDVWRELGNDCRFATKDAVRELIELYDDYDAELRDNNLIEFADQEMMLFELLQKDPYYLEQFGFKHIIVDEFQDTNLKQMELLKILVSAPCCESLMVVGDDSQAIFSFRDTSPEYIINFRNYIGEETDDIFLLDNHRCTPEIIEFANKINDRNVHKVAKDLVATRPSGAPVTVKGFHTIEDEEDYIITGVKEHLTAGVKPEEIAIICATKSELRRYANRLTKEGIESVSLNPEPLLENSRVKAAIAFVRSLGCEADTQSLLVYVNAKIGGGLFEKTEDEIAALVEEAKVESAMVDTKLPHEKKEALIEILKAIDHNDDEIYQKFLETIERKTFEKIVEYCNDFLIFGTKNEAKREHNYPGVVLTTCHSSKGLEWPVVYASLSKFDAESKSLHSGSVASIRNVEEVRRLLFVTATRARDELFVTGKYVAYGKKPNQVYNQFLKDAFECNGQTFSIFEIKKEADEIAQAKKKQRTEERKKIAEQLKKLKEETVLV
jgi:superfamily I DNA/RNA helicase